MIQSVPLGDTLHVRPESGGQPFHRRVVSPRGGRPQRGGGRGGNGYRRWQPFSFPFPLRAPCPGASQALQLARLDVAAYGVLDDLGHSEHGGGWLRPGQVLPGVAGDAGRLDVGPAAPAVGRRRRRRWMVPALLRRRDVLLRRRQISLQLARNEIAHRAVTRRRLAVMVVLLVRVGRRRLWLRLMMMMMMVLRRRRSRRQLHVVRVRRRWRRRRRRVGGRSRRGWCVGRRNRRVVVCRGWRGWRGDRGLGWGPRRS